ncbi:MAG TPA: type II toxin-antitoxin system RelE/ParE family toxin, partial [Bryobacteraceae bacterium]|nr:type II toxin-antitoxin system RelE/ParE family toxin [Bryobacteraceae bacterium]
MRFTRRRSPLSTVSASTIAEDNPDAADRVVTEIFDALRALVSFPDQGYRRPNLTSRPLRFKLC